ncbi:MAG: hypothetical protein QOF48_2177 [Verrucomicrobiota bacterium]|jgi:uncharacterized membrane protein (DUF485 family)
MTTPPGPPDIHSEAFLHSLMRRQLKLSIACAGTFMIALVGLPLLNYFAPELMARRVFGFTLTWFVLGVLFFPFVWIISFAFIKRSIALEDAEVEEVSREGGEGSEGREGNQVPPPSPPSLSSLPSRETGEMGGGKP